MNRLEKQELISNLKSIFEDNSCVVVNHYKGLSVAELQSLRRNALQADVGFKVVKNNLAAIALQDTQSEVLKELFVGPVAIAWSNDPITCTKLVVDFSKSNDKLVVMGGCYNSSLLSQSDVKTLASLPSMDELRGKLVGLLTAAATKLAVLTKTPATNVARVLKAYADKQ